MVIEAETTTNLPGDSELVTGNHLDTDTEADSIVDGLLGTLTGRVEDGHETDKVEAVAICLVVGTVNLIVSDGKGTKTTHGELLDVGLDTVLEPLGLVAGARLDDNTGHTLGEMLRLAGSLLEVSSLGTLVDGLAGLEVEELDAGTRTSWVTAGTHDTRVLVVLVLGTQA
jgi:hypothetical protein